MFDVTMVRFVFDALRSGSALVSDDDPKGGGCY